MGPGRTQDWVRAGPTWAGPRTGAGPDPRSGPLSNTFFRKWTLEIYNIMFVSDFMNTEKARDKLPSNFPAVARLDQ